MKTLNFPVPDEIVSALGSIERATDKAKEPFAMELLREGRLSQGKVAGFLGVSRGELLDLMVRYRVLSGPETPREAAEDVAGVESLLHDS